MDDGMEYVMCPYMPHKILRDRLSEHLVKCRRQNPNTNKVTCPYNKVHIVDKSELQDHLKICASNDGSLGAFSTNEPIVQVGTVSLEEISRIPTLLMDEDWSGGHSTYDPEAATSDRDILRVPNSIQSKAEKRMRKQAERDRMAQIERNASIQMSAQRVTQPMLPGPNQPLSHPRTTERPLTTESNEDEAMCSYFDRSMQISESATEKPEPMETRASTSEVDEWKKVTKKKNKKRNKY